MASKTLVPVEEYLRMSFDGPDREYVDGEIVERHLGSITHSKGQMRVFRSLDRLSDRNSLHTFPGLRVKVSERRYRVPDISVYFGEEPVENLPSIPPDIIVEIVSEDDRFVEIQEKLAEYYAWVSGACGWRIRGRGGSPSTIQAVSTTLKPLNCPNSARGLRPPKSSPIRRGAKL